MPSFFGSKSNSSKQLAGYYLLGFTLNPERGGSKFLQNVGKLLPDYTVSHPRRLHLLAVSMRSSNLTLF
jgi:hypothetical protein